MDKTKDEKALKRALANASFEDKNPIYKIAAGLDVHKSMIMATVIKRESDIDTHETKEFGTLKKNLRELAEWLLSNGVEIAAMESTGIYWKEPYHTLEKAGLNVILTNSYAVKHVPGHKTDVEDSRWLAILARSGLLNKSRVLDRERDQMRQASRLRQSYTEDMSRYKNRMYKMLIEAGFNVSQVVTDLFGKSGTVIVEGLLEGASPHMILKRVEIHVGYRLKAPKERLIDALQGEMSDLLRYELKMMLGTVRQMQANIADLEKTIEEKLKEHGLEQEIAMLQTIPGVSKRAAMILLLELGLSVEDFRSPASLASWAGMCPGNNESAGKRKSGRTNHGNKYIKRALCECAQSATKTECYLKEKFKILRARRGYKRGIVAIGHKILVIVHCMLTRCVPYTDHTADYQELVTRKNAPRWIKMLQEHNYLPASKAEGSEAL